MLGYIVWNVNPEIFSIFGIHVRWYGVLFALSFVAGYMIFTKIFKKEGIPIEVLDQLTLYMALGTIIGARLGHCLFYEPSYYLSHPLEIIKTWHGGLASHGAAIGILIALYLFSRKAKKGYWWILDRIAIVVALAGFFIRTGNLINSEIYGNPTTLPWGFIFLREGETIAKHPTQIYEALSYLTIFFLLAHLYVRRPIKYRDGFLIGLFLVLVFVARFLIEFVKEPQETFEASMSLNMGQLLSIPFIIMGGILIYFSTRNLSINLNSKKS
jgi:phosphatidylglycerol---prolipoprotein diacylglyceryl transferase